MDKKRRLKLTRHPSVATFIIIVYQTGGPDGKKTVSELLKLLGTQPVLFKSNSDNSTEPNITL